MNVEETMKRFFRRSCLAIAGGLLLFGVGTARADSTVDLTLQVNIRDTFAPEAVADLAAADTVTPGQAVLTWSAPEEDARVFTTRQSVTGYVVKYATWSVSTEIEGGGTALSWWMRASVAPSPPSSPAAPDAPETMVIDLMPGTTYWFAVRSLDDGGNLSPIDANATSPALQAWVFTRTDTDNKTPAPVAGFSVSESGSVFAVAWPVVSENDDGTAIADLSGYRVYRSGSLFDFGASSVTVLSVPVGGPLAISIPTPSTDEYYLVVALDTSGRISSPDKSNYLHVSASGVLEQVAKASDGSLTRIVIPMRLMPDLTSGGNHYLLRVEPNSSALASQGGTRTRATYSVALVNTAGSAVSSMSFSEPSMAVSLNYQGGRGSLDKNKTGVLWWNGVAWVKVGQADVSEGVGGDITVSFNTAAPGVYQIRQFNIARELTLDRASVFPQIFSPNSDGKNDCVYFVVENPNQSDVIGKILDAGGAEVGVMQPAGTGAPTADALVWDGRNRSGQLVPPGVYIYRITGEGKTITGSIVVAH